MRSLKHYATGVPVCAEISAIWFVSGLIWGLVGVSCFLVFSLVISFFEGVYFLYIQNVLS